MDKTTVFIADSLVLFREGIHFTLSQTDEFEIIGETVGNEEGLDFIEKESPAIAILAFNSQNPSDLKIVRKIKQTGPGVRIVFIINENDDEQRFIALKGGVSACINRVMDTEEVLNIARKVARGESPISQALLEPDIALRTILEFEDSARLNQEVGNVLAELTPAEKQILQQIGTGALPEEIVQVINETEEKVRQHMDAIFFKLNANDRVREVVDTIRENLDVSISRISSTLGRNNENKAYVTREEFDQFKIELVGRIKSVLGDLIGT